MKGGWITSDWTEKGVSVLFVGLGQSGDELIPVVCSEKAMVCSRCSREIPPKDLFARTTHKGSVSARHWVCCSCSPFTPPATPTRIQWRKARPGDLPNGTILQFSRSNNKTVVAGSRWVIYRHQGDEYHRRRFKKDGGLWAARTDRLKNQGDFCLRQHVLVWLFRREDLRLFVGPEPSMADLGAPGAAG